MKTCIESIFKYTNHPFELILVDNEHTKKYLDLIHHIYETDSNRVSLKRKNKKLKNERTTRFFYLIKIAKLKSYFLIVEIKDLQPGTTKVWQWLGVSIYCY